MSAKLAAGRPQDIADVAAMREATESKGTQSTRALNAVRAWK
jgi:hypothetical protein